ncbi:hypothetical protein [Ruegeria hyattellae]|uniref:hypothetical protein n=1 Tax=Ruegeria hyattellae TaxID=3233337 RepID=UPI00355C2DBB
MKELGQNRPETTDLRMRGRQSIGAAGFWGAWQVVPDRLNVISHSSVDISQNVVAQVIGKFRQLFLRSNKGGRARGLGRISGRACDGAFGPDQLRTRLLQCGKKLQGWVFLQLLTGLLPAGFERINRSIEDC